jgi:DNA-binding response OmpR family regulator
MGEQKRIYIADDEKNIREGIQTFLENAGYSVEAFENGNMLLETFRRSPADLVILDVMMPGASGFTICKEIRRESRVPIIILTARDSDLDYMTGMDLGSDDYFTKPFSPMSLVMRVKAVFRRIEFDRQDFEAAASVEDLLGENEIGADYDPPGEKRDIDLTREGYSV